MLLIGLINSLLNSCFYSFVPPALRATSSFARVQSDTRATYAGRSKRVAAMAVSTYPVAYGYTNTFSFSGCHHTCIKEEPVSPAKPTAKCKAYLTSGANLIGNIKLFDKADIPQGSSKWQKTSAGATAHVQFDSTTATTSTHPPPRTTRKSTHTAKANPKVEGNPNLEMDELFERLGKEFHAIGRTCETIVEAINSNM